MSYACRTWLVLSRCRHSGGPDLEIYGSEYYPIRKDSVIYSAIAPG